MMEGNTSPQNVLTINHAIRRVSSDPPRAEEDLLS